MSGVKIIGGTKALDVLSEQQGVIIAEVFRLLKILCTK